MPPYPGHALKNIRNQQVFSHSKTPAEAAPKQIIGFVFFARTRSVCSASSISNRGRGLERTAVRKELQPALGTEGVQPLPPGGRLAPGVERRH
jgi:hypothetical protein